MSAEQEARDLMEKCGWEEAQSCSAGEVVFLANRLRGAIRLCKENERLRERVEYWENKEAHEAMQCYVDNKELERLLEIKKTLSLQAAGLLTENKRLREALGE